MPLTGPGQDPAVLVAVLTYLPLPARLLRAGLERGLNAARGQYKYWAELRSGQGLLRPGGAAERRSVQYRDLFVPPRCSHARSQARGASPAVSLPAPIACGITRCPRAATPPQTPPLLSPPREPPAARVRVTGLPCPGGSRGLSPAWGFPRGPHPDPALPVPVSSTLPHVQQRVAAGAAVQCRWGGLGCCADADGHRAPARAGVAITFAINICLSGSALIEIPPGCCQWTPAQQPCLPFNEKKTESR